MIGGVTTSAATTASLRLNRKQIEYYKVLRQCSVVEKLGWNRSDVKSESQADYFWLVFLLLRMMIRGKLVILRPLSIADAPRFCGWLADLEVTKFLNIHDLPPPTLHEEREWLRQARADRKNIYFAIDTIDGVHIGSIGLRIKDGSGKVAEYGILIGDKRYWGQGCGTEAGVLMVEYGFRKLKLHRIYLKYIAYNIRGRASYKKIGFKHEGRLRQHLFHNGYWHDKILMGLLREEYIEKLKIKSKI